MELIVTPPGNFLVTWLLPANILVTWLPPGIILVIFSGTALSLVGGSLSSCSGRFKFDLLFVLLLLEFVLVSVWFWLLLFSCDFFGRNQELNKKSTFC